MLHEIADELRQADRSYHANWLLWGPGGAGKTRLVVEINNALDTWDVNFLKRSEILDWRYYADTFLNPNRPTLIVVDDADQYPPECLGGIADWYRYTWNDRRYPAALLCIARVNPEDPSAVSAALDLSRARTRIRMVPPIDDRTDQLAILNHARTSSCIAPASESPEDLPMTPLALIATALAEQSDINALNAIWEWQRSAWRRTIASQGGEEFCQNEAAWSEIADAIEQALLAATLGCAFNAPEDVAQWWGKNFRWKMHCPPDLRWLADRLLHLFPRLGNEWQLPAIEPLLLAGHILSRQREKRRDLLDVIFTSPELQSEDAAAVSVERIIAAFDNMHKYLGQMREYLAS